MNIEIYRIEIENDRVVLTTPYYNEKGRRDNTLIEKLYYKKIGERKYRFSKNEIEDNIEGYDEKNIKELESYFFDQHGDLVKEME
jgi:hypothetical protein